MPSKATRRAPFLAVMGPGMLIAATGVGAGDLAAAGFAGSKLGLAVLWAVLLGAILKFVLTEGLARWQLATGSTLIEGAIDRLGLWIGILFAVYFIPWTYFTCGALINAAGVAADAIVTNLGRAAGADPIASSKIIFGIAQSLLALGLVWIGGFKLFERVMTVCVGFMFVAVVVTAALTGPDLLQLLRGLTVPTIPDAGGEGLDWTIALMGGVGGTVTILCYGYWIREQGRTTPDDIRTSRIDLVAGYAMTAMFGVATVVIATGVQVEGKGLSLLIAMADRLNDDVGPVAKWLFLIGAWAAIFSSLLGVWQAVPYLFADLLRVCGAKLRREPLATRPPVSTKSTTYRIYLIAIAFIPLVSLWRKFDSTTLSYTLMGAAFLPLLAVVLIILNSQKRWLAQHRNHPGTIVVLILTVVLFVTAGIFKLM